MKCVGKFLLDEKHHDAIVEMLGRSSEITSKLPQGAIVTKYGVEYPEENRISREIKIKVSKKESIYIVHHLELEETRDDNQETCAHEFDLSEGNTCLHCGRQGELPKYFSEEDL